MEWAGEALHLLPARAVWWPRGQTLFIADPHFGKAATFRAAGLPVSALTEVDDLGRLESIVAKTGAARLVILGDFFHARKGRSETTLGELKAWRDRHEELEIVLVAGNHDRHAGAPPEDWGITCVAKQWACGPFLCCHEPEEVEGAFVLAGHLHPAFHLHEPIGPGVGGGCFWFGERVAVLPAFGSFTGTHRVKAKKGERVFLIGPGEVVEVNRG